MTKAHAHQMFDLITAARIPYVQAALVQRNETEDYAVEVPFGSSTMNGGDVLRIISVAIGRAVGVSLSNKGFVLS